MWHVQVIYYLFLFLYSLSGASFNCCQKLYLVSYLSTEKKKGILLCCGPFFSTKCPWSLVIIGVILIGDARDMSQALFMIDGFSPTNLMQNFFYQPHVLPAHFLQQYLNPLIFKLLHSTFLCNPLSYCAYATALFTVDMSRFWNIGSPLQIDFRTESCNATGTRSTMGKREQCSHNAVYPSLTRCLFILFFMYSVLHYLFCLHWLETIISLLNVVSPAVAKLP